MRKAAIRGQALVCVILSFIGLVNYGVLFWMSGKTKQKMLRVSGVVLFILCICSLMALGNIENDEAEAVITWVCMGTIIAPTIINCANLKTFVNCQSLWSLIEKIRYGFMNYQKPNMLIFSCMWMKQRLKTVNAFLETRMKLFYGQFSLKNGKIVKFWRIKNGKLKGRKQRQREWR